MEEVVSHHFKFEAKTPSFFLSTLYPIIHSVLTPTIHCAALLLSDMSLLLPKCVVHKCLG